MGGPRWLDEREARVWQAYLALNRELHSAVERRLLRDSGLSNADYALLVPLSEAPDGVVRSRELGALVGWERSRLSHQIGRMEKRGLVVREECAEDARGSMVRLTAAGRAAIESAAPGHVATVRRYVFDDLTPEEATTLDRVFHRVLDRIAADP
ncbi:DNA-binding MarR family transcriptional regulator [Saccharothrix saharensis]|uniref:DNA-binding MarR family transcriptional regulator n=1 Tax=Saccharothrix saharensis TaxID=571190 RepID=A0A543J5N0_9PSEU|nr:MarR family winged helix-turn-helix transcriptional regulator [Saccharothrix saharensis]TQM78144.1 DNA-binding MarR family transcriptional regulator [Saccharothrix saharensis]